jgi:hypothetical protein
VIFGQSFVKKRKTLQRSTLMTTSEIVSGHSHSFDVGIAKTISLNAAIVYNHIAYWIKRNAAKKDAEMIEGRYWMYETQQEMAVFLEYMTLVEIQKAVVRLLDAGLLIKGNFNKNPFDKTNWYALAAPIEIKKVITKSPQGDIGVAPGRYPDSPRATCIYVQKEHHKEEQQQQDAAAVFPDPSSFEDKPPNVSIHPCLSKINIPDSDKVEITKRYPEQIVLNAIAFATSSQTKITKGLAACIKWACQNKPEVPRNPIDEAESNKAYAKLYDGARNEYASVDALSKHVEVIMQRCQSTPTCISYEDKSFREQLDSALRKVNIPLRKQK